MKLKGVIGSMFSGSVGGATASHNRGGYYLRQRVVPTNPNTDLQSKVRAFLGELSSRWSQFLDDTQRAAWNAYALATPLTNPLGDPVNVGGKGMYIRGNVPRGEADFVGGTALGYIDAGPVTAGLPPAVASAADLDSIGDAVDVSFDNTQAWATSTLGALLVFSSRVVPAGVSFFRGPYRLSAVIPGAVVPPTSPVTVNVAFPVASGQKVGIRLVAVWPDGRLTSTLFESLLVAS